ncbi:MAG TPA: cellulase family glycosylhydrolase [Sphingomonas sp.]|jgi:hypothetical protein
MKFKLFLAAAGWALTMAAPAQARDLWTKEQANAWYARQPWLVGANYNNASAINQFEMWQAETWNPTEIDRELALAQSIGMNTMRVYLHNMLWERDAQGLKRRMNEFLTIAQRRGIRPMFVLFDSCWDPDPVAGPQRPPIPGVHNSGWVQAPGAARLADRSQYGKLEAYVRDIVGSFANDDRVLAWDVWNEPNNEGGGNYKPTPNKKQLVAGLLDDVFEWARSEDPTQPLTSGLWIGENWDKPDTLDAVERIQVTQSDVNSFHDYNWPEQWERRARQMLSYGRPVLCTEYMARGNGSTFDGSLPLGKKYNIAMINWGFVDGKTQTRLPWDSWKKPYTQDEPTIWFHEVFRADGKPYRQAEVDLIRRLASEPKVAQTPVVATQPARRRRAR